MADEEIVNPKPEIEEACRPQCVKSLLAYEQCAARIADDQTGEAHCTGQYFDMLQVWRLSRLSLVFLAVTAVRLCNSHRISSWLLTHTRSFHSASIVAWLRSFSRSSNDDLKVVF